MKILLLHLPPHHHPADSTCVIFPDHGTFQGFLLFSNLMALCNQWRNSAMGISCGCGYVTTSSVAEGSNFCFGCFRCRWTRNEGDVCRCYEQGTPGNGFDTQQNFIFESPHKAYVRNLAHTVTPRDLRNLFSQFVTVVSSQVLRDSKSRKDHVCGFISFSSFVELDRAISLDGIDFCGRKLLVREALGNKKP